MPIEVAVLTHLLAGSDVAAIVGTRGYQLHLPQKPTLPALRTQLIDEIERVNVKGQVANLFKARIQVDVFASEFTDTDAYTTAREGITAVRNRLAISAYGGQTFNVGSPGDIQVTSVQPMEKAVEYESEELRQVRARQDFEIMYLEA